MLKSVERSSTIGHFDPAVLCRMQSWQRQPTMMPVLPREVTLEIEKADRFERKDFWEKAYVVYVPIVAVVIPALLALYAIPTP